MRIIEFITKNKKIILYTIIIVLISVTIGAYGGMSFYKDLMKANAAAFWMMGVESSKKGNYDYALFYYTQAIALHNDEPLFYQSLAEAYEAKKEIVMAVDFYKTALDKYKEKKRTGPAKFAEYKIKMLQKSDNQNLVKKK